MNVLDLVAVLLIVLAAILGFRSGFVPQAGGLFGAVTGGAIVVLALPALAEPLGSLDPAIRPYIVLLGLLLAVGLGESIGSAIGRSVARALGTGVIGAADRTAGGALGIAQAVLVIWLAGGLLALGPVPRLAEAAQTSTAVRTLNSVLPPPTEVAADLGELLDSTGLPDVFVGFDPLPRPPVDRPSDARARAIGAPAERSVFRVSASTCGLASSGSSAVVAIGYLVTNAHVVAGSGPGGLVVTDADGDRWDARVVLFDPQLDVALLWVPGLPAPALRFATSDPPRGAIGATLGYPGGGALTVEAAAVTGSYTATGRDIHGEATVMRDLIELRADVDRGDSGGPFVVENGTIGGLVFAEARTDPTVGYALSPTSVATRIAPGIGRTSAVETGACVR